MPRTRRRRGTCPLKAETDRHTQQFRSAPEPSRQLSSSPARESGVVGEGRWPGWGTFTPTFPTRQAGGSHFLQVRGPTLAPCPLWGWEVSKPQRRQGPHGCAGGQASPAHRPCGRGKHSPKAALHPQAAGWQAVQCEKQLRCVVRGVGCGLWGGGDWARDALGAVACSAERGPGCTCTRR